MTVRNTSPITASLWLATVLGAGAVEALSDNISNASSQGEVFSSTSWAAAKFTTDGRDYDLISVELLMMPFGGGRAKVGIYAGLTEPEVLVATLVSPKSYAGGMNPATFTASIPPLFGSIAPLTADSSSLLALPPIEPINLGIHLAADSSYWVVLQSSAGAVVWSHAYDINGTGAGFATNLARSYDSGTTWLASDSLPFQMRVNVEASAVPEPGQWAMMAVTALGIAGYAARRVRAKTNVG